MRIALSYLWLALFLLAPAFAEPRIRDLQVTVDGGRALLSFDLMDAVDERFVERVESGLPTSFVYRFQLIRGRRRWFDSKVESNTLEVIATYDAVRQQYLVNYRFGGKLVKSRMVRDLTELEQAMTHFEQEPIFNLEEVPGQWRLRVRARAEFGSKTILLLIPSKITTDWVESERFRSLSSIP